MKGMVPMNCMDCQKMIMPFINEELDNGQLGQFLDHLKLALNVWKN